MRAVAYTIWILCVSLVIASIDTRPDPPALNPTAAQSKAVQMHDLMWTAPSVPLDSPQVANPLALSLRSDPQSEPYRPTDCLVLTSMAADSSPPAA